MKIVYSKAIGVRAYGFFTSGLFLLFEAFFGNLNKFQGVGGQIRVFPMGDDQFVA